jgi:flagellar M-ring protein FliF
LKTFWQGLSLAARVSLAAGIVLIVAATVAMAVWLLRTERDVLFGNLSAQDAAAMTAELDRMKLPYALGADGTSILVDKATLHQTRLKLMSKDIPLHGAVGFELFNNTDFGMTEFAQKVNYQRALQGEITRTIMSLAEVESVRVHLAFPEEGLFKREQGKAKAAITVALKHGQSLRPEQVKGIQRLVSASVAGVSPQDVTVVDQTGVALTRVAAPAGDGQAEVGPQLELKRDIEQHLAAKAAHVLDRAFGPGRALASVDVVLDMNQVRTTTEDVVAPPVKPGEAVTGVIVRERETFKGDALQTASNDGARANNGSSQRETDYQVGRRVEQVVSQPGSVRRLQVLAVIKVPLDAEQIEQTKSLVAAAVGASLERGDVVVVQPLNGLHGLNRQEPETLAAGPGPSALPEQRQDVAAEAPGGTSSLPPVVIALGVLVGVVALVLLAWTLSRGRQVAARAPMTEAERQAALAQVRQWLAAERSEG